MSEVNVHRVGLLHVRGGHAAADRRLEHTWRQARHFEIEKTYEIELPDAKSGARGRGGRTASPLRRPGILLAALDCAIQLGATRLVWPGQFDGNHDQIATASEQLILIQHLAQLAYDPIPTIETPLLELSDLQLLDLGTHMQVIWDLAWSCDLAGESPCMACAGCRRRHAAFEEAGLVDPIEEEGRKKPIATG